MKILYIILISLLLFPVMVSGYEYRDSEVGEQLIIRADRESLFGIASDYVYFNIKNMSGLNLNDVEIYFQFDDTRAGVSEISYPIQKSLTRIVSVQLQCRNFRNVEISEYRCLDGGGNIQTDENGMYWDTIQESYDQNFYVPIPTDSKPRVDRFRNRDFVGGNRTGTISLTPGEMRNFRAKVSYEWRTNGEFLINARSRSNPHIFGILDPTWFDSSYLNRRAIITQSDHNAIDLNYTFNIRADITSWTVQGDFDDIRIVDHFDDTELDRLIVGTTPDINILFRANHATLANVNDINYYIYYNNPSAVNPPADSNKVYQFADEFNDGVINTAVWTFVTVLGTQSESGGVYSIVATSPFGNSFNDAFGRFATQPAVYFYSFYPNQSGSVVFRNELSDYSASNNGVTNGRSIITYPPNKSRCIAEAGNIQTIIPECLKYRTTDFNVYSINWAMETVEWSQVGDINITDTNVNVPQDVNANLHPHMRCSDGGFGQPTPTCRWDYVRVYHYLENEVDAVIGAEEDVPASVEGVEELFIIRDATFAMLSLFLIIVGLELFIVVGGEKNE